MIIFSKNLGITALNSIFFFGILCAFRFVDHAEFIDLKGNVVNSEHGISKISFDAQVSSVGMS